MSGTSKLAYFLLTLVIGYVFVYSPFGEIQGLMEKKEKYILSLETISNIENVKNELMTKFNAISEDDKKNINTILPNSVSFVRLISQIDAVAAKHSISIGGIGYQEFSSSGGDSIGTAQPTKPYKSSLISFSFDSGYENFKAFMDDLGKSMQILDIRSVSIGSSKESVYTYNVAFETYWLEKQK